MRKLKINRIDFETAFELNSYETTAYLDTETDAVIFVEDYIAGADRPLLTATIQAPRHDVRALQDDAEMIAG